MCARVDNDVKSNPASNKNLLIVALMFSPRLTWNNAWYAAEPFAGLIDTGREINVVAAEAEAETEVRRSRTASNLAVMARP